MPPKLARLIGFGALGAIGLFVAVYALIIIVTFPRAPSGMTTPLDVVTWIAVGLVILALIATHLVIARQLLYIGKGGGPRRV